MEKVLYKYDEGSLILCYTDCNNCKIVDFDTQRAYCKE